MLTLFEELFILAIHESKGRVINEVGNNLGYGLGGAVLAELALQGKVRAGENHRLVLVDSQDTGDEIVDSVLAEIRASDRERKVTHWLRGVNSNPEKFQKRLAERLVEKGVARQDDTQLEWVIHYLDCPGPAGSIKYWIKRRLRSGTLTCEEADLRDLALLNIALPCGMVEFIYLRDELKLAKHRIYEMTIGKAFNNPFLQTIEEIQTAVEAFVSDD